VINADNQAGSMDWQFAVMGAGPNPYKISNLVRGYAVSFYEPRWSYTGYLHTDVDIENMTGAMITLATRRASPMWQLVVWLIKLPVAAV
jgi:hypothetical protein